MRTKLTLRANHFATIHRTLLIGLAGVTQFYSFCGFNFKVCFVYYFMIFLNVAHSRDILSLTPSFENRSNILPLLNFIKFKRHLRTLLLSFPFKHLYFNTLWNDSQTCFYRFLILLDKRYSTAFLGVSKNSGNNSQTARFLFVTFV